MTIPKLSKRLRCAADLVRKGSFVADVGTDHAYLPIALLAEGKIRGGVVSDINQGPIDRARANLRACGMADKLSAVHCDGLSAIAPFAPEDILILGMGGELIASILAAAPWTKNEAIRLILQPMTHPEALRRYLLAEGFAITEERLVEEDKLYQLLVATYTGAPSNDYTALELLLGRDNLRRRDGLTETLLLHTERVLKKRLDGKRSANADTGEEDALLQEIGEWKS